jgi:uncharacterized membrane protein
MDEAGERRPLSDAERAEAIGILKEGERKFNESFPRPAIWGLVVVIVAALAVVLYWAVVILGEPVDY